MRRAVAIGIASFIAGLICTWQTRGPAEVNWWVPLMLVLGIGVGRFNSRRR
jgi:hypothetical protein